MHFVLTFCTVNTTSACSVLLTLYIGVYLWVERSIIRWWGLHIHIYPWNEKYICVCNFLGCHPVITGTGTGTVQKSGKYSLNGKTLLHSPSYDIYINGEADGIWKGSSNQKYQIVMIISSVIDVLKCIWK